MKLDHVLRSSLAVKIDLNLYRSEELKRAARFWVGKEAGSFNKEKCIAALTRSMADGDTARRVLAALTEQERQVLGIFARYGPTVSGGLLSAEVYARGILVPPPQNRASERYYQSYREWHDRDPVPRLREKFVLVGNNHYDSYYSSYDRHRYPQLTLHPTLAQGVEPAPLVAWRASHACAEAVSTARRSSAQVGLDLWRVAEVLRSMKTWQTVQGDSPAKATRARLQKEVGLRNAEKDPMSPPDAESFYYELLHNLDLLSIGDKRSWVREEALERHLQQPAAAQAKHWVRAWLHMPLWQDGIGVVPDRDSESNPVRIEPSSLAHARELLVWALCGVAHAPSCWLDLETFLRDFWQKTREAEINFYWGDYSWDPEFEMGKKRDKYPVGDERMLAFWLAMEAVWAANGIMVTLATLGLVERGQTTGNDVRPCFRLTELGRVVFGAPEVGAAPKSGETRFLALQPNLEIVAYLDSADARQVCILSRFAASASRADSPVQTFELRRDSLYRALESGMTLEEVRAFLTEHGRTELPANVERMLSEWAGRRESLTLRTKTVLALGPLDSNARAQALNDNILLLPSSTAKIAALGFSGWTILDHEGKAEPSWTTDELGSVAPDSHTSISQLRLARIADRTTTGWQITSQSVGRARLSGVTTEQILLWLGEHVKGGIPPLLGMAVRNWTSRQGVQLRQVQLLRIMQPQAQQAFLQSPTFRPHLAGHIPPEWFLIYDDHLSEVRRLLETLGFAIAESMDAPLVGAIQNSAKESSPAVIRIKPDQKRRRGP
jgi:hypothetical protein